MPLSLQDFDYSLPQKLIAQYPARDRSGSRLLRMRGTGLSDQVFSDLPKFLQAGDVLVFNDTRVIKARLYGTKESGGKIEALIERVTSDNEALAQIRASKSPKPGTRLTFGEGAVAEVVERQDDLYLLRFETGTVLEILDRYGHVPLPPYITHADSDTDLSRYQTIYAHNPGAVAAPTAGLHFDEPMLEKLRKQGVNLAWLTLHVGAGTFQPVRVENLDEHKMHSERYDIPDATVDAIRKARKSGHSVVAVGTTSLRALESASRDGQLKSGQGETDLFITPGYRFNTVDRLVTNFHLPKSTLLMLVSAFAGLQPIQDAYQHAIEEHYRFFSYGDAMLMDKMAR